MSISLSSCHLVIWSFGRGSIRSQQRLQPVEDARKQPFRRGQVVLAFGVIAHLDGQAAPRLTWRKLST